MRWLHTTVIVVLIAGILIFAVQNLQSITVSFLNLKVSAPLAVLFALVYMLGMVTGGSSLALIRWAMDSSNKSGWALAPRRGFCRAKSA
jgi:putative membrane protein